MKWITKWDGCCFGLVKCVSGTYRYVLFWWPPQKGFEKFCRKPVLKILFSTCIIGINL